MAICFEKVAIFTAKARSQRRSQTYESGGDKDADAFGVGYETPKASSGVLGPRWHRGGVHPLFKKISPDFGHFKNRFCKRVGGMRPPVATPLHVLV